MHAGMRKAKQVIWVQVRQFHGAETWENALNMYE